MKNTWRILSLFVFLSLSFKGNADRGATADNTIGWMDTSVKTNPTNALLQLIAQAEHYLLHSVSNNETLFRSQIDQAKKNAITDSDQKRTEAMQLLTGQMQSYLQQAEPKDGIAFDMTFLMKNPELTTLDSGWSLVPTVNYGEAEIFNRTFDFYQVLTDMRPGVYRIHATGFHRNGAYATGITNEANAGCVIYGNQIEQPLLTLYDVPQAALFSGFGGYANTMQQAQTVFNKGFYTGNEVVFQQEILGEMVVGLRNKNTRENNWTCFREFKLEYLGGIETGKMIGMYRIVSSNHYLGGCLIPGDKALQNTPLYHTDKSVAGKEAYWYLYEVQKKKYALKNVATGQFITWDNERTDGDVVRRYVALTDELRGDSSLWTLQKQADCIFTIRNVKSPNHLFDLRTDSKVVGAYDNTGPPASNQLFCLYDAYGRAMNNFSNESFQKGIVKLEINGRPLVYDRSSETYFFTIPQENFRQGSFTCQIDYTPAAGYSQFKIGEDEVKKGDVYTFLQPEGGRSYTLEIQTEDGEACTANLTFTALPVVQLYGDFNDVYSDAHIKVTESMKMGAGSLLKARVKWRGATTRYRQKKQYAIKLYHPSGEPMDVSFFDLRDDNNWILDGMCIDKMRMRNRVVTDLWNDFVAKPYYFSSEPKALSGTRGQFVELLLNDQYAGIYCMTEKMDRKQMKLKKYDEQSTFNKIKGELWKSSDWSYAVFMGHHSDNANYPMQSPVFYTNSSETWDSYEVKYPDIEDGQEVNWSELYHAVNFVCTAGDDAFSARIGEYFDLPVLMDYYILMETILSADNHGKNMYFAVYDKSRDKKITFGLWDLDSTCGRRWDSSPVGAKQDYTHYITQYEHGDYNLFRRMKTCNVNNFNEEVRKRYKKLRQGELSTARLLARFAAYKDLFDCCGATAREEKRWTYTDIGQINLSEEMNYLSQWFTARLDFMDKQWNITALPDEPVDGVFGAQYDGLVLKVHAEMGTIVVQAEQTTPITICTLDGKIVKRMQIDAGAHRFSGFEKGIYLVNRYKVVVR